MFLGLCHILSVSEHVLEVGQPTQHLPPKDSTEVWNK